MKWQSERDLLIAQTMAFVQSVAGRSADAASSIAPARPSGSVDVASESVAAPREVLTPARLSPLKHSDMREEIQRRVAAFRARQQLFDRDRSEYCNATLAKVRAVTEQAAKAVERQPIKR